MLKFNISLLEQVPDLFSVDLLRHFNLTLLNLNFSTEKKWNEINKKNKDLLWLTVGIIFNSNNCST